MRVAIVSPHPVDPPDSGDRVRTTQLAAALRQLGIDVTVLAYSWQEGQRGGHGMLYVAGRPMRATARPLWRARLAVARRRNVFALHRSPGMHGRMRAAIDKLAPDVIDFQHSFTWFATSRPSVVTVHNVESDRQARYGGQRPAALAGGIATERAAVESADATVVFSELDGERLREHTSPHAVHVVPLGFDPGAPLPPPRRELATIAYVGSFDYPPNVEAVNLLRDRWDAIRSGSGVRRLLVVGRRANEHFSSIGELEVRSDVPSVRDALVDADALVVPLIAGGGVRVKIIEAFRLGLPVVSTELGIEGLGAEDGKHAAIVGDPSELPEALDRISPVETRIEMARNAQELWDASFSPRRMAEAMLEVYRSVRR